MFAVAAERSLAPPSYADKACISCCVRGRGALQLEALTPLLSRQVALAANTTFLSRDAAYEILNSVTKRPAAVVGASLFVFKEANPD